MHGGLAHKTSDVCCDVYIYMKLHDLIERKKTADTAYLAMDSTVHNGLQYMYGKLIQGS